MPMSEQNHVWPDNVSGACPIVISSPVGFQEIAMATFCMSQWHDGDEVLKCYMNEDVKALQDALENLNTPKSSLSRILTGIIFVEKFREFWT